MTYVCNYCGIEHDASTKSVEHVVPEKLLNSTLVLPDVCRFWNNLFARAFETAVVSSEFMGDVLLEFTPVEERPRGAVYLGQVATARQTTEHRWLVNGEERLRDMPTRRATDVVTIDAFDDSGDRHSIDVHLPFSITTGGTGDEHAIENLRKHIAKQRRRLSEYLTGLARNPAQDAPLYEYLKERGLHLREPKAVDFDESLVPGSQGGPVDDILPRLHALDQVRWTKFYMKIGWCFACLKLGRAVLRDLGGDGVLNYLRAEALSTELVEQVREHDTDVAEMLFRDASIDGGIVWLWRVGVADGQRVVATAQRPVLPALVLALEQKQASESIAATWIHFAQPGALDRAAGVPGPEHRNHHLKLRREVRGDRAALVCEIALFGGILAATVQLTPQLAAQNFDGIDESAEVIAF